MRIWKSWRAIGWILVLWKPFEWFLQSAEHVEFISHHWPRAVGWLAALSTSIAEIPPWVGWVIPIAFFGFLAWDLWFRKNRQAEPLAATTVAAPSAAIEKTSDACSYLHDRDTELGMAVYLMAHRSAWGRWFSAQYLAGDGKPLDEQSLMKISVGVVVEEAMNGKLEIRGRPKESADYESIPREQWRLSYLDIRSRPFKSWQTSVIPRDGVDPERINRMLNYDSLIVDSNQFEEIWPRRHKDTHAATLELCEQARKKGVASSEIDKLLS